MLTLASSTSALALASPRLAPPPSLASPPQFAMQVLKRGSPLLRRAAGSAPTTAALQHAPLAVGAKAFLIHSLAKEVPLLTLDDLNKSVSELRIKNEEAAADLHSRFKRCVLEQNTRNNLAMIDMKCEIEKETIENRNKYCLDRAEAKHQLKVLHNKLQCHKHETSNICAKGSMIKMKNYGWSVGLASAILTRLTGVHKLFKINGKH